MLDDRTENNVGQLPAPKDFIVSCKRQKRIQIVKCELRRTGIKAPVPQE